MADVVLVSMPFGPLQRPSLALSLLQPPLDARGISTQVRYLAIPFAERIGVDLYQSIASGYRPTTREQAGEWVFSHALHAQTPEQVNAYLDEVLRRKGHFGSHAVPPKRLVDAVVRARDAVLPFLDECADLVLDANPRLVGFTSIFQQHVASLALARRLKARRPDLVILFGGANCEGVMGAETLRQFPWVNAVVSGEGDAVITTVVERLLAGRIVDDVPGVLSQRGVKEAFLFGRFINAPTIENLDDLPYPDFRAFFEQYRPSPVSAVYPPGTYLETSRGCWWGERMHCTFCGLNGTTMRYRSKSAARAFHELTTHSTTWKTTDIQVVDNILDLEYFKTLLPQLAASGIPFDLFYETKSNLKRDQVRLLRDAGILQIQPGIESLSNQVLKLMRKGVSALQNIQLLKWCKELGVLPQWNLIAGFPGESPEEYARMARLASRLVHLPPPNACGSLRLDRFSPNFEQREQLGFVGVEPLQAYEFIYDVPAEARFNLAYYFRFEYRDGRDPARYVQPLVRAVRRWQRHAATADLFSADTGTHLVVCDLRPGVTRPLRVLDPVDRAICLACDAVADRQQVALAVARASARPPSEADLQARLRRLVARGVVVEDGARFLSVLLPLGDYTPNQAVLEHFYGLVAAHGRRSARGVVLDCDRVDLRPRRRRSASIPNARLRLRREQFSVAVDGTLVFRSYRAASAHSA
ncbi:MAG: RiPP maturation radical SAM C-methyltransferase [Vicinamibacterales bacterium]